MYHSCVELTSFVENRYSSFKHTTWYSFAIDGHIAAVWHRGAFRWHTRCHTTLYSLSGKMEGTSVILAFIDHVVNMATQTMISFDSNVHLLIRSGILIFVNQDVWYHVIVRNIYGFDLTTLRDNTLGSWCQRHTQNHDFSPEQKAYSFCKEINAHVPNDYFIIWRKRCVCGKL